jgi:bisphosphoglycerate-independent phosphoglycerate mutase (AlkP superfamily)
MITSYHGNIEDVRAGHTLNPVLSVLYGPGALERRQALATLTDVTPAVLRWLE